MRFAVYIAPFVLSAVSFAEDLTGTWKLNVEKSKASSDVASETETIERTEPNTYRIVFEIVPKSGKKDAG